MRTTRLENLPNSRRRAWGRNRAACSIARSPMSRHVTGIEVDVSVMSGAELALIQGLFPKLTRLRCHVNTDTEWPTVPLFFAPSLTTLTVTLSTKKEECAAFRRPLADIGRVTALTTLELFLRQPAPADGGIAPGVPDDLLESLANLPSLNLLHLFCYYGDYRGLPLSHAHVDVIRRLSKLTSFGGIGVNDGCLSDRELDWLTAPLIDGRPSLLALTRIGLDDTVVTATNALFLAITVWARTS